MLDDNNDNKIETLSGDIIETRNDDSICGIGPLEDVSMVSYNFTNISDEKDDMTCEEKNMVRRKMINEIKQLNFSVIELALYLDTHPDDTKALNLFKQYTNKLHKLKDEYQKIYGPLTIYFPCNKWRWIEQPWPWERGNF